MSQRVQTYRLPLNKGGYCANPNIGAIDPLQMVDSSWNINIHNGKREHRGGTSIINTLTDASQIMGICEYNTSGTQFIVRATANGKIWKNVTTTIHTGWTVDKYVSFTALNGNIYASNGADTIRYWDGAAASMTAITSLHADWTGTNHPSQILTHTRGQSRRMIALGCPTTPYSVYISANNAAQFLTADGGLVFDIEVKNPRDTGLAGMGKYGDRIIFFTQFEAFYLNDTDASSANWGIIPLQIDIGASHWRNIINTPNDLIVADRSLNIFSMSAVQEYGDYKVASLTIPARMDKWIRDNLDLSQIAKSHICYDPKLRLIKFFAARTGDTQVKLALVYWIDAEKPEYAWSPPHVNFNNNSGYNASCSAVVEKTTGDFKIYTGDYAGRMWELETANKNDNSVAFTSEIDFPYLDFDNPRNNKLYKNIRAVGEAIGNWDVTIIPFVDGTQLTSTDISLGGGGDVYGTGAYGTAEYGGAEIVDDWAIVGSMGKRIKGELLNSGLNEGFAFTELLFDYIDLEAQNE